MKKQSLGGLFDFSALNRVIKNADDLYWYQEDGLNIVSDGHAIFRFIGEPDSLFTRFKQLPAGKTIGSRKHGKEIETFESAPGFKNTFDKFLNEEENADVQDTRLTYEIQKDRYVRVLYAREDDYTQEYIMIGVGYFDCINDYNSINAPKASRKIPVTFCGCNDEKAVILPVNYDYKPAFLDEIDA